MTSKFYKVFVIISGVVLILLLIIMIILTSSLRGLKQNLVNLDNQIKGMQNSISILYSSFSSQLAELNQQIEETNSVYYDNSYEIINYNPTTDITTINYHIKLKEHMNTDTIYLVYAIGKDATKVVMENNNSIFNIDIDIDSNKSYDLSLLIEGETIISQDLGNVNVYEEMMRRFNYFMPDFGFQFSGDEVYADIGIDFNNSYNNNNKYKIVDGSLNITYNNETLLKITDITSIIEDYDNIQSIILKKSILITDTNITPETLWKYTFTFNLIVIDEFGFTYQWTREM